MFEMFNGENYVIGVYIDKGLVNHPSSLHFIADKVRDIREYNEQVVVEILLFCFSDIRYDNILNALRLAGVPLKVANIYSSDSAVEYSENNATDITSMLVQNSALERVVISTVTNAKHYETLIAYGDFSGINSDILIIAE